METKTASPLFTSLYLTGYGNTGLEQFKGLSRKALANLRKEAGCPMCRPDPCPRAGLPRDENGERVPTVGHYFAFLTKCHANAESNLSAMVRLVAKRRQRFLDENNQFGHVLYMSDDEMREQFPQVMQRKVLSAALSMEQIHEEMTNLTEAFLNLELHPLDDSIVHWMMQVPLSALTERRALHPSWSYAIDAEINDNGGA